MRMASLYVLVPSHEREEEVDFGGDYMGEWSSPDSGEESEETEAYPPVKVITFMTSDQVTASHNISDVTQRFCLAFHVEQEGSVQELCHSKAELSCTVLPSWPQGRGGGGGGGGGGRKSTSS